MIIKATDTNGVEGEVEVIVIKGEQGMISMKDIAITCGVSVATVSKALNGHKDIGENTKRYIVKTAKEMGYYPNSAARTLKTN